MTVSWLTKALTLGLLAITLPLAAAVCTAPGGCGAHSLAASVNTAEPPASRVQVATRRWTGDLTFRVALRSDCTL